MHQFVKIFILFLIAIFPASAQGDAREQGLVTNDPLWRQALGGAVVSLPSVQAQSAVVALDGGNIRAYSTAGTSMWNFSARGRISPYVTRSREGTSYISRTNGTLIAVNRAGRELWRRDLGSALSAHVITGWDGRLFAPADNKIVCYTASGNQLWTQTFETPFFIAPKLDRYGGIIFALENKEICRSDPFGNLKKWTISNTPAQLISIEQQKILIVYTDGAIEILDSAEDWFFSAKVDSHVILLPKLPSNPLAAAGKGNNIAAVMRDGRIAFVSADEKKIIWTGDTHIKEMINSGNRADMEAEMFFDERGIYILSRNGVSCFSPEGKRLWFTFLQNAASIPAFGNDGVLYSGGNDWILYAYKIEDRVLREENSLYGPKPQGSYGMGRPRAVDALNIPLNLQERKAKLDYISKAINQGKVGENEPDWTSFLLTVSAGREHIQMRLNAISLLGKMGSLETIPWLVNIFKTDNEPTIRAAAITAIGDIGVDPQGTALQTFLHLLIYDPTVKDGNILTAIASATGALCRFSGPPLSEMGIKILNMITAASQPHIARRQANKELASLR
ncbi:MAG: PQQ-binding-like beta-propeller repeat protein [Treponema sp.]|nr:PQQ-binding-like beta-propeller repeat protein [Treponema sp.]